MPGAPAVDFLQLDLADLATVRTAAAVLLDSGEQLSVLINNAGVMATPPMKTKDGFEFQVRLRGQRWLCAKPGVRARSSWLHTTLPRRPRQLGINHLSHFLLTALLRPLLEAPDTPTRVVNVSSVAHFTARRCSCCSCGSCCMKYRQEHTPTLFPINTGPHALRRPYV